METKICRICVEEKPITDFAKNNQYKDGYDTRCKACVTAYHKTLKRKTKAGSNPALADFTPRELIEELRTRGYKGTLEYTKTITL
jgi:superfamily II helicase